jgi:diadenosine tetraphosphate (Ap4A) HIT family hydrolase
MGRRIDAPEGDCPLCATLLTTVLRETKFWRTALNTNQQLMGQAIIALRRHEESVAALTADEWLDLRSELIWMTTALDAAFHADHYNYAFLQNQDRHVHLHVFPRYAAARRIAGVDFTDPDYPDHYRVPSPMRTVDPEVLAAIESALLSGLASPVEPTPDRKSLGHYPPFR